MKKHIQNKGKSLLIAGLASSAMFIALATQPAMAQTSPNNSLKKPGPQVQKLVDVSGNTFDFSKSGKPGKHGGGVWQQVGGGAAMLQTQTGSHASSGRVSSIAISEDKGHETIYLGAADGGVWSSNNHGTHWDPLTDNQASLSTGSVTVDPSNPKVIYVGTGEQHYSADSQYGKGILKSTDGGKTWTVLGSDVFGGKHIGKVAVDPHDSSSVWVAADPGLYHSTDGGATWTQALAWRFGPGNRYIRATDVYIDANTRGTMYANFTYYGLQKSTDGGQTWTPIDQGLPGWLAGFHSAAMAVVEGKHGAPDTLYVSAADLNGELMGMFVSKDGGSSWTKLDSVPQYFDWNFSYTGQYDPNNAFGQGPYDNAIAVDPTDQNHILAGGITLIESHDGGKSWAVLDTFTDKSRTPLADINPAQHTIAFDSKGNAFVGNDGGIFEETTHGDWKNLNTNQNTLLFHSGMSAINDGSTILAGVQDNGTLFLQPGSLWSQVYGGTGGYTYLDTSNANVMFAESQYGNIVRRTDTQKAGNVWIPSAPGYVNNMGQFTAMFETPFTVRPMTGKQQGSYEVIVGSGCVARSTDDGNTYDAISGNFTFGPFTDPVVTVSQSKSNPNTVYAGTMYGQVYASFDAESQDPHWTAITPFANDGANHPDRGATISSIAINPTNDKEITLSYGSVGDSNFAPAASNHVYFCRDTSAGNQLSWTNATGNLPVSYVDSAQYAGPFVLVGTDQGVYATLPGSSEWIQLGTGLPNVPVTSIVPEDSGKIVIGTYGRGAFALDLGQDATGLLNLFNK